MGGYETKTSPPGAIRARIGAPMVEIKPGSRFQSTVCTTEVIAVKGSGEAELLCGGAAMVEAGSVVPSGSPSAGAAGGTKLRKRYSDADEAVESLCTKAGQGSLAIGAPALAVRQTKPPPPSD